MRARLPETGSLLRRWNRARGFHLKAGQLPHDMRRQRSIELEADPCALPPGHFGHIRTRACHSDLDKFAKLQTAAQIIDPATAKREIININLALEPARGAVGTGQTGRQTLGIAVMHDEDGSPSALQFSGGRPGTNP